MRIVREDPKLGISKVVWTFPQEPDSFVTDKPEVPQVPLETEEPAPVPENDLEQENTAQEEGPGKEDIAPVEDSVVEAGHLSDLRQQIRFLQQVIESQNQQLNTKDELIRNFQVLLKTEQDQVLKLEARVAEKAPEAPSVQEKSGWFRSLAKKLVKQ